MVSHSLFAASPAAAFSVGAKSFVALATVLVLAACSTVPSDRGLMPAAEPASSRTRVAELSSAPLSAEAAVEVALLTRRPSPAARAGVAVEARRAYFQAVASTELAFHFEQVKAAADVASELAHRMVLAGNLSELARMREQLFQAEATARLARVRQQARADRERLARSLGVDADALRIPSRLPELPASAADPPDVGRAGNADASSRLRESYATYRAGYDLAKHYHDEIVPLRKRISEENLLRYNGMLIGVFELLADAREQTATVLAAIEALRDFWLADVEWQALVVERSVAGSRVPEIGAPPAVPMMADHRRTAR